MPDLNVWLALSWGAHPHSSAAWEWFRTLAEEDVQFCRFTQVGLLRLLTTRAVMGDDCLTVRGAWSVYDQWLRDPRIEMPREAPDVDDLFRRTTAPYLRLASPKVLGDCYLLALARASGSVLVTFDDALSSLARRLKVSCILLV